MIRLFVTTLGMMGSNRHIHDIVDEIVKYNDGFTVVDSPENADCVAIGCQIHEVLPGFDREMADRLWALKKPLVSFNIADDGKIGWDGEYSGYFSDKLAPLMAVYFHKDWFVGPVCAWPFPIATFEGCHNLSYPVQTEADFMKRPIDLIMTGAMHRQYDNSRMQMFSKIQDSFKGNAFLHNSSAETGAGIKMPFGEIMDKQRTSKISISLEGGGQKGTRHNESSCSAVMALQGSPLKWTYPWVDMENCILLPYKFNGRDWRIDVGKAYDKLMDCLSDISSLYKIYLNGVENNKKYSAQTYYRDYVGATMRKYL